MNRDLTLRLILCVYLLLSAAMPYMIFNADLPLEAVNYMKIVGEVNSGINLSNFLSKVLFITGNVVGFIGVLLIYAKKHYGLKPFIIGGAIAFLGLIGLLPRYLPSVFTTEAIALIAAYFFTFGLATAMTASTNSTESSRT